MFLLPPQKCFQPKIPAQFLKDFSADYLVKVVSPTHKNWIQNLDQIKSTQILIFRDFFDLVFKRLDILFGWLYQKQILLTLAVMILFEVEPKKVKSFLDAGEMSLFLV